MRAIPCPVGLDRSGGPVGRSGRTRRPHRRTSRRDDAGGCCTRSLVTLSRPARTTSPRRHRLGPRRRQRDDVQRLLRRRRRGSASASEIRRPTGTRPRSIASARRSRTPSPRPRTTTPCWRRDRRTPRRVTWKAASVDQEAQPPATPDPTWGTTGPSRSASSGPPAEAPTDLGPWILATTPGMNDVGVFCTEPVRIALATQKVAALFDAYGKELRVVVRAASGQHPEPPGGGAPGSRSRSRWRRRSRSASCRRRSAS